MYCEPRDGLAYVYFAGAWTQISGVQAHPEYNHEEDIRRFYGDPALDPPVRCAHAYSLSDSRLINGFIIFLFGSLIASAGMLGWMIWKSLG